MLAYVEEMWLVGFPCGWLLAGVMAGVNAIHMEGTYTPCIRR